MRGDKRDKERERERERERQRMKEASGTGKPNWLSPTAVAVPAAEKKNFFILEASFCAPPLTLEE